MTQGSESDELYRSFAQGQWGFQFTPAANSQNQPGSEQMVMRAQLPGWMARSWTVSLNAHRFAAGTLLPGGFSLPDNQVQSGWKMRIQWGGVNASESVLVDYMARGCSFQVIASDLSVFLQPLSSVGSVAPRLSGSIAPAGNATGLIGNATFTTSFSPIIAGNGGQRTYLVPDRAIAYRWFLRANVVTAGSLTFEQLGAAGGVNVADLKAPIALGASQDGLQANKAGFIPLAPDSEAVLVTNTDPSAGNVALVAIQWLLDMG